MTEDEIKDTSLLRCTLKKSCSVLWKVLKYGAYLGIGILATVFAFYGAIAVYEIVLPGVNNTWQFLIGVPWYYYAGILVIAAIPVHSLWWCITRDLTTEDWESDAAAFAAVTVATFAAFVSAAAFVAAAFAVTFAFVAVTFAFAAFVATFAFADNNTSYWYYVFRFFGAVYHHYTKKRNKPEISE